MLWTWLKRVLGRPGQVPPDRARALFEARRAALGEEFLQAARASGKPRGLRWVRCDWAPGLTLARDRQSGALLGLVGVTISFEAVEGSDMEGLAAVGNLRDATGLFYLAGGAWRTGGKAVFNLAADEVLARYAGQYEPLPPPSPG